MKCKLVCPQGPLSPKRMSDMKIGELGVVVYTSELKSDVQTHIGEVVLCIGPVINSSQGVVSLNKPVDVWDHLSTLMVRPLHPFEKVILTP